MPDWIKLLFTPLAYILRRPTGPSEAILNRVQKMLDECEDRCEKRDHHIRRLYREVIDLRRLVVILEEQRLVGTLLCDSRGIIIECNPAMAALCDCSREDLTGQHIDVLIPYRFRETHAIAFEELVTGKRPLRKDPVSGFIVTLSGREIPISILLTRFHRGDSARYGVEIRMR